MQEKLILEKIHSVRRRLSVQKYFQTLALFLFYGLLVCVPVVIVDSFVTSFNISPLVFLYVACGIAAIALVVCLMRPVNLYEAARAIDIDASLKDRVVSGLEQIERKTDETLTALQLQDTSKRLETIPLKQVARYTVPRQTKFIAIIAIFLITFSFVEFFSPPAASTEIDFSPQIAAEANTLLKKIEEAKKEAEQSDDAELEEILKEIEERTLQLKKPKIAPKEALARMTELSALLKKRVNPAKLAQQEKLLKGLGDQFIGNPILGEFGQQVKLGDYQKAAQKLDKVAKDVPKFDAEKRQNLSDELKRAGKNLKGTELSELGGELSKSGTALAGNDMDGTQKGLRAAGKKISDFSLLKKRNLQLAKLLAECEACKAGIAGACQSKGKGKGLGLAQHLSNKPNEGAGEKTSATQQGQLTSLDARLNLEHVTGVQGEGDSTVQTDEVSAEGQQSALSYKDAYMKYQKLSEDALTQEQIPLGYKFYVKRYFESIKPSDE